MTDKKVFVASDAAKKQAKTYRIIAILAWLVAIAGQIYAIMNLISDEKMTWLIVTIVVILILAVAGNLLWKRANKLDPASEKDKFKFFVQSQLGAIMSVLAFLPLAIVIFTNKDISGKTKGIAGAVVGVALLIGVITGVDPNPPSIEKYTEEINQQTEELKKINFDKNNVYWTEAGNKYHIFEDCQHIKNRDVINNGTVRECWEDKSISELCKTCKKRAIKAKELLESETPETPQNEEEPANTEQEPEPVSDAL